MKDGFSVNTSELDLRNYLNFVDSRMDFESPDVEKDFPGLYASESGKKSNESDFSDDTHERISKKDLLIGKRKDKKDSKKDRGYATLEGESSPEEDSTDIRSPSKAKKLKPFKFPSKKEKREKSREKDTKEKDVEKDKDKKKENEKEKDKKKDKDKTKLKSKERKKLKHGEDSCDIGEELPIFGVALPLALERSRCHDGVEIPLVVRDCIMHIQEIGLLTESVYKISGIKSKVQQVKRLYNQREPVNLSDYDLPVATSLLKLFIRELPESLLTNKLSGKFEETSGIRDIATRGVEFKILVQQLPSCNIHLLSWIVKHLDCVSLHEKQNKMSSQSLSQILCQPMQMSQRLLAVLMYHSDMIFSGTKLTKYIPPLTSSSSTLPETTDEITKELRKQESLLGQIHNEMHAGYVTKQREELLWEVQRMITQLKRKLKSLEKEAGEVHHLSSIQQQYQGGSSTGSTGGSTGDDTTVGSVAEQKPNNNATVVDSNASTVSSSGVLPTANVVIGSNNTIGSTATASGGTRHVVEAVIETTNINTICKDISPQSQVADTNTDVRDSTTVHEKLSVDELSLILETEELLALIAHLQSQIEQERSDVACLRSEIRNLGGSPSFCDYLLESCGKDMSSITSSIPMSIMQSGDKDNAFNSIALDEQNATVTALLRQVKAETQMLQTQKKNLTDSIIEEQELVAKLKVQVKLLSLSSQDTVVSPTAPVAVEDAANTTTTVMLGHAPQCLAR